MEMLDQVWAWIQSNPEMVLNGIGGGVLGPMIAKLFRGGMGVGFLGGVLGGVGAGFGADAASLNEAVSSNLSMISDEGILAHIQNLAEGAIGGGGIGGILGGILKRR